MGFYGNITNTARTSFSFDKTYSNRYDMDTSCGSDGIYAGRYVLVEYDTILSEDTYPTYYYYDGQMYSAVNKQTFADGSIFITSPQVASLYQDAAPGLIVRVPVRQKVASLNKQSRYIKITTEQGDFATIDKTEYDEYLKTNYAQVEVTAQTFDGSKLYLKDGQGNYSLIGAFILQTTMTNRIFSSLTGSNVYSDSGLWVYIEKDAHGDPVNRYVPLGLGGTVDDDGQTTWKSWWEDRMGTTTFNITDFDDYYLKSQFDPEKTYYMALNEIMHQVQLTPTTFEQGVYYCHDGNDKNNPLIVADSFNAKFDYFEPGIPYTAYISNDVLGYDAFLSVGSCIRVPIGHIYSTNETYCEYWIKTEADTWHELSFTTDSVYFKSSGDTNYLTNFAIDVAAYGTNRGYDSTVWQKVYANGTEKYVMVAELNSVVPTFDVSADPPSMAPLTPHFDNDSTNMYYKLHWQPSWGLRTKAASNSLLGIQIAQDGTKGMTPNVTLTSDEVVYPSDATTQWRADFYDTKTDVKTSNYYNIVTSRWDTEKGYENADIPAAVYFNLDGFNPDKVAYSKDIIDTAQDERYNGTIAKSGWRNKDAITLAPTGKSGHMYNQHGHTLDQVAAEDVQELSIMLPSIGDTLANMWDMVFGGRDTNEQIAETNERNTDIRWENARADLSRHGLRLVNDDDRDGYATDRFSTAEVNTIAGAINSAHDIIGMIITNGPGAALSDRIDELDEGRIYYNETDGKYYRKHKTYDYTVKDNSDNKAFTYTEVTVQEAKEDFNPVGFYIQGEDGSFVPLPEDAEYDENQTYYKRTGETYEVTETPLSYFDSSLYFYMDYTGSEFDNNPLAHLDLMDYIKTPKYLPGHKYYTIDSNGLTIKKLIDAYRANKYFYLDDEGNYALDARKAALPNRVYYDIDKSKVVGITDYGFNGIYKPGTYYFYDESEKSWRLDQNNQVTLGRKYYIPSVKKTDFTTGEDGESVTKIYRAETDYQLTVPADRETFERAVRDGKYYYSFMNESLGVKLYSLYTKDWDTYCADLPELYVASIKYVLTDEDTVTIDENNPFILAGFYTGAYYLEIKDADGKLIGYKPVTMDMIDPSDATLEYKAFVYGVAGINDYQEWSVGPYCPFAVNQDWIAKLDQIESYACQRLSDLYFPNTYHYKDRNGSYILDTYEKMTHDTYYLIAPNAIHEVTDKKFFEPYEYYIFNEATQRYDKITGDLSEEEILNNTFYTREQLYVYNDALGIFDRGAIWNPNALKEPDTITLATRKARWELKEIPSFARTVNTMHGLLLKINALLEYDDTLTRDERIANGLLNQVRDLIAKFDSIIPRNFITVDDYGRITSTDWTTLQTDSAQESKTYPLLKDVKGDVFEEVDDVEKMRKQWITLNLDGDVLNPTLTVHHNFQHVTDTTSDFDLNAVSTESRQYITNRTEVPRVNEIDGSPVVDEDGNQIVDIIEEVVLDPAEINDDVNAPSYVDDESANTLQFYTPIVDDMGHVVGHNTHTVTLPFSFKTYHIAEQSDAVADLESNTEAIVADNTQDNLTFASGNKWVKMAADADKDTITIGHEVHEFTSGAPNIQYGLAKDQVLKASEPMFDEMGELIEVTEEVLDMDNTFEVPNFSFDEAGHITQAETHTVVLPENFTEIHFTSSDEQEVDSILGDSNVVVAADSLIDTLNISEGNRWINLNVNPADDSITISHYIKQFAQMEQEIDFNEDGHPDFAVQNISWDNAGHLLSSIKTTYTLPFDFKTLSVMNNGANATTIAPGSAGNLIAGTSTDTAIFTTGNRWITFAADEQTNTFTVYHAAPGIASPENTKGVHAAQTPNFGDSFTVPTIGIDETGHVASLTESIVKIPLPSLTNGEGNVVTRLDLNAMSGALTETRANVGTLKLTDYKLGTDYNLVDEDDTINSAFSKIQLQVKNITTFLDAKRNNGAISTITIEPNYTCTLDSDIEELNLNFEDTDVKYYAEYRIIFNSSEEGAVVSIPKSYTWDGDEPPTLKPNKKYIIMTDNISHIVTISKGVSVR